MTTAEANRQVVFYEKTGCVGNAKQRRLLEQAGIRFDVKSMLDTPWTRGTLEPFFEGLEKTQIINPSAPKVKSGEVDVSQLSMDSLIELMIQEPILIKRPLIEVGSIKICGFDMEKLNAVLNIALDAPESVNQCQRREPCSKEQ